MTARELIDVELDCLRGRHAGRVKIDVVNKVVDVVCDGVAVIGQSLRRERPDDVIVPKNIGIWPSAADVVSGGASAQRRRCYARRSRPIDQTRRR